MKNTKSKLIFLTLSTLVSSSVLAAEVDLLTGDTKLACEATLCLSSGNRPSECSPSLDRYFGINHRNWADTVKDRLNFLSLCPASGEPGMPALVRAIANGAGRCDAEFLNKYNTYVMRKTTCRRSMMGGDDSCHSENVPVVNEEKPAYCVVYDSNEYTYNLTTKYIGTPTTDGFWADADDYDSLLNEYLAKQQNKQDIPGFNKEKITWSKPGNSND